MGAFSVSVSLLAPRGEGRRKSPLQGFEPVFGGADQLVRQVIEGTLDLAHAFGSGVRVISQAVVNNLAQLRRGLGEVLVDRLELVLPGLGVDDVAPLGGNRGRQPPRGETVHGGPEVVNV